MSTETTQNVLGLKNKFALLFGIAGLFLYLALGLHFQLARAQQPILPNLTVSWIEFKGTFQEYSNVIVATVCNKGSGKAVIQDVANMQTQFEFNGYKLYHHWNAMELDPNECSDQTNSPFIPLTPFNYITKSGYYDVTVTVDMTSGNAGNIDESVETDNTSIRQIFVDLGTPPVITDLKIVSNELQWTAPKADIKRYFIRFYTGETNNPSEVFGGCSGDIYQSGDGAGGSAYCAGEAIDINFQSGHLEKLKLSRDPVKTYVISYEDKNGKKSAISNLAVHRKQNLPAISSLKIVGDELQWTAPNADIQYYYVSFFTGETYNANESFGGCTSAEVPSPNVSNYCAGEIITVTGQAGHLERIKLTRPTPKTYVVIYQDKNGYLSPKSNLVVHKSSVYLPPINDVGFVNANELQWTAPNANISRYIVRFHTSETTNKSDKFGGCEYDMYQVSNPGGPKYCVGEAKSITFQPGHRESMNMTVWSGYSANSFIVQYMDLQGNISEPSNISFYKPEKKPDLVVSEIGFYKELDGLENVLTAQVCNWGDAATSSGTLSTSFSIYPDNQPYGEISNFHLTSGECTKLTTIFSSPFMLVSNLEITESGYYTVTAKADIKNTFAENNENNNSYTRTVYIDIEDDFHAAQDLNIETWCAQAPGCDATKDPIYTKLNWTNTPDAVQFAVAVYTGDISTEEFKKTAYLRPWVAITDENKKREFNFGNYTGKDPIVVAIKLKSGYNDISDWSNVTRYYSPKYDQPIPIPPAGFEDEVLTTYNIYQNPFPDTNMDTLEGQAASELYRRAVLGGYPDGEFKGYRDVNRAELAKFLLLARYGTIENLQNNGKFPDVLDGQWYVKFVIKAAVLGIIQGYPDGFFRPEQTVNTAEFTKMITLTFGLPENLPYTFTDVAYDQWYARYAGVAQKYNLFPYRGNLLQPDKRLTRNEVAVAIYQYLKNREKPAATQMSCGDSRGDDGLYSACQGDTIYHNKSSINVTVQSYTSGSVKLSVQGADEGSLNIGMQSTEIVESETTGYGLKLTYQEIDPKYGVFIKIESDYFIEE